MEPFKEHQDEAEALYGRADRIRATASRVGRLKQLVADLSLDKAMLQDALRGKR